MEVSRKKVTMTELARRANVDISTVSRALNGSPIVNAATREHIVSLAEELGYVINASARNLRRQSSETLGMVVTTQPGTDRTISDPFFLEMLAAVSQAAARKGYDLIITVPEGDHQLVERRLLQTGRADGLILVGEAGRTARLAALGNLCEKMVIWGEMPGNDTHTVVGSDNRLGGKLAGEHLLSLGRQRLLFIGNPDLPEVGQRYEGFRQALSARGLSHDPRLVLKQDFGDQETFAAVRACMAARPEIDGVFAASDVLAIVAMDALRASGKSIPQDVAVMGYDNIGHSALTAPGLTTIDQSIQTGGALLVERLLSKLAGAPAPSVTTPTSLIVRGSTVPG